MRIVRTNFDRQESRRDHRYVVPALVVVIGGRQYVSSNWSLGGFLLTGNMPLMVGAVVIGTLHVDGSDGFEFTAEVVRRDDDAGAVGFEFRDMTPLTMTKLDRALAQRLVSRRR